MTTVKVLCLVDDDVVCRCVSGIALPLLALASATIVVGDDKQTSPEHVGLDRQAIFDLMDDYLREIPRYRTVFDPDRSLYDLATLRFSTSAMLTEHFRCLPEIIAFSNHRAYGDQIIPLRDQPPRPGWVPLGLVSVGMNHESGTFGGVRSMRSHEASSPT